jgi:hypothetical protein
MCASASRFIAALCSIVAAALSMFAMSAAVGAVPASEREVLLAIYEHAGGDGWTAHTGWGGGVGTECTWDRVICDASGTHVIQLALQNNHLVGTLPPISALTELHFANFDTNDLDGPVPELAALSELVSFGIEGDHFTGHLPSLTGLVHLQELTAAGNELDGPIPSLSGLASLEMFFVQDNHLTGPIPDLEGLSHLTIFNAQNNELTGITGLGGLTNLTHFLVDRNRLEGPIPPLDDLENLLLLLADHNHLSGPLPSLAGLHHVVAMTLDHNELTGPIPDPPNPTSLVNGPSTLCPNRFAASANPDTNEAWDGYTGTTPWNRRCHPDAIFAAEFDGDD